MFSQGNPLVPLICSLTSANYHGVLATLFNWAYFTNMCAFDFFRNFFLDLIAGMGWPNVVQLCIGATITYSKARAKSCIVSGNCLIIRCLLACSSFGREHMVYHPVVYANYECYDAFLQQLFYFLYLNIVLT